MPIFPTEKMAEEYARKICLKLVNAGKIPKDKFDECVNNVKSGYSSAISDIDDKWAEGIMTRYKLKPA